MLSTLKKWDEHAQTKPLILGYGSLMSRDSRARFSGIHHDGLMVTVKGYRRGWITRSIEEKQTYVGALPDENASLNALLVPVALDPALAEREKDYQFEKVAPAQIFSRQDEDQQAALQTWLANREVYICRSLLTRTAEQDWPVHLSYVDTCMTGCLEVEGEQAATDFVKQTAHWNAHLVDDRAAPQYPRAARTEPGVRQIIDDILRAHL